MREYDRAVLLERIEREGSTVGVSIPLELEVDGESHAIRRPILELQGADELSSAERERAGELVRLLTSARAERLDRITAGSVDRERGDAIAEAIAGIDRALNALAQLDAPGVAEQANQRTRVDYERWLAFIREALGHERGRRR